MKTVTATVTSKGQVTIPRDVRRSLNVFAGDGVDFLVRDDGVVELRRRPPAAPHLFGRFAAYTAPGGDREAAIEHAAERDRSTRK
jgi:AbrB family looped-hinge helix DNA binding protein